MHSGVREVVVDAHCGQPEVVHGMVHCGQSDVHEVDAQCGPSEVVGSEPERLHEMIAHWGVLADVGENPYISLAGQ